MENSAGACFRARHTRQSLTVNNELYQQAETLGQNLLARGMRLAVAESCTGGWLSKTITDVPGSSQWFEAGVVTYSNRCKQQFLSVPAEVLELEGAVSEAVVKAMARGTLAQCQAHMSIAISGIAGPDGGSPEKPVGTVWIAWASVIPDTVRVLCEHFRGDRESIRLQSVRSALQGALSLLGEMPGDQ